MTYLRGLVAGGCDQAVVASWILFWLGVFKLLGVPALLYLVIAVVALLYVVLAAWVAARTQRTIGLFLLGLRMDRGEWPDVTATIEWFLGYWWAVATFPLRPVLRTVGKVLSGRSGVEHLGLVRDPLARTGAAIAARSGLALTSVAAAVVGVLALAS